MVQPNSSPGHLASGPHQLGPAADPIAWLRWAVAATVVAAVACYYLWGVRLANEPFYWFPDLGGYYNYLARGLIQGHLYVTIQPSPKLLALPNPWDPAVDETLKMHDMALYNGRYYLYHGVGPAVMLFVPWKLVTQHDLPENLAVFLMVTGGFLFSCGTLLRVFSLARIKPGSLLLGGMLLALGMCQSVPFLLNRIYVYEVAISGGYLSVSAAWFFLAMSIQSRKSSYWLAASGLMFGMAVACRPHLVFAGAAAFAGLVLVLIRSRKGSGTFATRDLLAFLVPLMLVGAAQAAYNYLRFGDPLEFGVRYLLAGENQNRVRLAAENVAPGLYYMLFNPPEFSPVFPWMRMVFRLPFNSTAHLFPPGYFIEATVGALYLAPFVAWAWLMPLRRRTTKEGPAVLPTEPLAGRLGASGAEALLHSERQHGQSRVTGEPLAGRLGASGAEALPHSERQHGQSRVTGEAGIFLWMLLASSVAVLLFLSATGFTTHRYEADFLPMAVLAALAVIGIHMNRSTGAQRAALGAILAVSIAFGAVMNLALGISGPYDGLAKFRPANYVRIARWFSPIERFRPILNPRLTVDFTVKLTPQLDPVREPLVTMGHQAYRHFLYLEHSAWKLHLVSYSDDSTVGCDIAGNENQPLAFHVVYEPETGKLKTSVNGKEVLVHDIKTMLTAPADVTIGENRIDPTVTPERIHGRVYDIRTSIR